MATRREKRILTAYRKLHDRKASPFRVTLMNLPLIVGGPTVAVAIPAVYFWPRLMTTVTSPFWFQLFMTWLGMMLGLALMSKWQGSV